jgi:hypothetical protein
MNKFQGVGYQNYRNNDGQEGPRSNFYLIPRPNFIAEEFTQGFKNIPYFFHINI